MASEQFRGTAGSSHLDLVRRVDPLERVLNPDRQRGTIANAEAAKVGPDTALASPITFPIGMAGRHAQIAPDVREIIFLDSEQIDPLAAGQLDHRHLILLGHVRNSTQLGGTGDAACHLRHDGKRTIFLDIGVNAFIDETRVRLFHILASPDRAEQGGKPGLTGRVFFTIRQCLENSGHRF